MLARLVECVGSPGPDEEHLDIALAEADLVLRATDTGEPCSHVVVHEVGWDRCTRCSWRRMVDQPATERELAMERAEIYGGVE